MAKKRIVLCNFYITMATSAHLWLFETGQLLASHAGIFRGARRLQNSPYFCVFKYARAVKQKVWNEAENRERDWGETLKIRFFFSRLTGPTGVWGSRYRFLYWFWEKNTTILQSREIVGRGERRAPLKTPAWGGRQLQNQGEFSRWKNFVPSWANKWK